MYSHEAKIERANTLLYERRLRVKERMEKQGYTFKEQAEVKPEEDAAKKEKDASPSTKKKLCPRLGRMQTLQEEHPGGFSEL